MNKQKLLDPLLYFLKIPSISTQKEYEKDMEKVRSYLVNLLRIMGFKTKILKGKKHDAVYAEYTVHNLLPTVLIYGHYDVQPPDPLNEWKTPPFEPVIKNDEIFARGSADNKGQIMIHLMTVKKLLKKGRPPVNFKFIIEGEEEIGSPSIESFAKKYSKNLFKCNYLVVSDTSMKKGNPAIDIGLRGLVYTEVTLQTAKQDLHSGVYGGVAENPINLLSQLISKLKDEKGHVLIPGFYEDVAKLSKKEIEEIKYVERSKEEVIKAGNLFGIGGGEEKYLVGERVWTQPTLDVNGIWGGYQEEGSKTIIPAKASAKISMRLVPNQDNDKIYKLFIDYVKKLVPKFVKLEILRHADCFAYIAPTTDPVFSLMKESQKKVYKKYPVFKRVSGSIGFVPIMAKALNVPVIMVGFAYPGSKVHAPNEHFNLSNYYNGIEVMEGFYSNLPSLKIKY